MFVSVTVAAMRPSPRPGEAGILTTVPECRIVQLALNDADFSKDLLQPAPDGFEERFIRETYPEPRLVPQPALVPAMAIETGLVARPDFHFYEGNEAAFVKAAAQRIISQRHLLARVENTVTRRLKTAKNMLEVLGDSTST